MLSPGETRSRLSYDHSRISRQERYYILLLSCFEMRSRLKKIISRGRARKMKQTLVENSWDREFSLTSGPNLLLVEETSRFWKAQSSVLVMSQKSWSLGGKLMVFSSSLILGDPGGCSAGNGGNEQNGRHGIIDKGAAKPGFCHPKMFFFQNHFHTFLKSHETRLLPFQDVFFGKSFPPA